MFSAAIILASLSSAWAGGFDPSSRIAKMKELGRKFVVGKNDQTGVYIICAETVEVKDGNPNLAIETAKMQARVAIAEFMSVKIEHLVKSGQVSRETVSDSGESFSMNEFRASCTKKSANQIQKGLTVCLTENQGNKIVVYCLLTEKIMDATAELESAMKKLGPNTVKVNGMGYFGNGVTQAQAEKNAVLEAQREAIAQVLGMSMVSQTSRQTISKESVDKNGNEDFSCDDMFKAKVFASASGFVEQSRIVDKKVVPPTVIVTIIATVAKNKLMSDYRSYLESMGNPGFCVRSNDRDLLDLYAGFFAGLGCRMVDNLYDAAYVIDVHSKFMNSGNGLQAAIRVVARDKVNGTTLFTQENNPSELAVQSDDQASRIALCRAILNKMKPAMHASLNEFIGRANADGRKIQVKLNNYESDYSKVVGIIFKALEMVPGASNVRKKVDDDTVIYTLNYKGETEDLAAFLEKHIKVDIRKRSHRPVRGEVSNTCVEFDFK
ncbi:MAG: hypothetical protein E7055_04105 [Lentisphaerae bacterium]|nr:hypothetical protein [Lentisphaerota bacterium]